MLWAISTALYIEKQKHEETFGDCKIIILVMNFISSIRKYYYANINFIRSSIYLFSFFIFYGWISSFWIFVPIHAVIWLIYLIISFDHILIKLKFISTYIAHVSVNDIKIPIMLLWVMRVTCVLNVFLTDMTRSFNKTFMFNTMNDNKFIAL